MTCPQSVLICSSVVAWTTFLFSLQIAPWVQRSVSNAPLLHLILWSVAHLAETTIFFCCDPAVGNSRRRWSHNSSAHHKIFAVGLQQLTDVRFFLVIIATSREVHFCWCLCKSIVSRRVTLSSFRMRIAHPRGARVCCRRIETKRG